MTFQVKIILYLGYTACITPIRYAFIGETTFFRNFVETSQQERYESFN